MYDNLIVILISEEVYMFLKKNFCVLFMLYICMCSFLINFVNYMYLILFMVYIYILISIVGFIE